MSQAEHNSDSKTTDGELVRFPMRADLCRSEDAATMGRSTGWSCDLKVFQFFIPHLRYDVNGQHVGSLPDLNLVRFYHACTTFTSATGEQVAFLKTFCNFDSLLFQGLIVAGGSVGKSTEVYLPSTNKWTVGGALPR